MSSWKGRTKARRCLQLQQPAQPFASRPTASPLGAGGAWGSAPSLGCSGQHVRFGMHFVASKGFPEIPPRVFIPWQTGLAAVQPVCF